MDRELVERTLRKLKMYSRDEAILQAQIARLLRVQTYQDLKDFIAGINGPDVDVRNMLCVPIRTICWTNKYCLLGTGQPDWRVMRRFKKLFCEEDGAPRLPVADDHALNRKHLGAMIAICRHPDYGRKEWDTDSYKVLCTLRRKEDKPHEVAIAYLRALYSLLPELEKVAPKKRRQKQK